MIYQTVEEAIAATKDEYAKQREESEALLGNYCDALLGFIKTSSRWKAAIDQAFSINVDDANTDPFTARALSLSILTTRILNTALDISGLLRIGAMIPAIVSWRIMSEAKNAALLIDLDPTGSAGFLWLHHGVIEQAKMMGDDPTTLNAISQGKEILAQAGFKYDSRKGVPWALGIDGKTHSNAVDRCKYVWKHRKFPMEVDQQTLSMLESAEIQMIRQSNTVAHPTLYHSSVDFSPQILIVTACLEPMAVMLAYKAAGSHLKLWPPTETVGDQFHVYPPGNPEPEELGFMAMELYFHCWNVFTSQFLEEEQDQQV